MFNQDDMTRLAIDMLNKPTERSEQRLIGASEIGNPCNYCLAKRLLGIPRPDSPYWLGAKIGDYAHAGLELEGEKHLEKPENYRFEALEGALIEQKITLGTIEGYGTISSKPDLVLTKYNHLNDWKTSTKSKIKGYKLFGPPAQYIYQQQLYAWGLNNNSITVDTISLTFIAKDGTMDSDVWVYWFDYDETVALSAWNRLEEAWKWLQAGNDYNELESHHDCFSCNALERRIT